MIVLIILGKLIPLLLRGRTSFLKVNNFTNITRLLIKIAFVWLGFSWDFCFDNTMTFSQFTSHLLMLVFSYYSPKVKKQCTLQIFTIATFKKEHNVFSWTFLKVLRKCSFFHAHTANFLHSICRCKREKKFSLLVYLLLCLW